MCVCVLCVCVCVCVCCVCVLCVLCARLRVAHIMSNHEVLKVGKGHSLKPQVFQLSNAVFVCSFWWENVIRLNQRHRSFD